MYCENVSHGLKHAAATAACVAYAREHATQHTHQHTQRTHASAFCGIVIGQMIPLVYLFWNI